MTVPDSDTNLTAPAPSIKKKSGPSLVWLIPLLPLVWGRWRHIPWIIFMVAAVMTQFIYPYNYIEFEMKTPYLVGMMAGRNFLLVVMVIVLMLPIKRRQIA